MKNIPFGMPYDFSKMEERSLADYSTKFISDEAVNGAYKDCVRLKAELIQLCLFNALLLCTILSELAKAR